MMNLNSGDPSGSPLYIYRSVCVYTALINISLFTLDNSYEINIEINIHQLCLDWF